MIDANSNAPSSAAESWTEVVSEGNVVTVKVALVAPPGTVTLAGTRAVKGQVADRLTLTPTDGAGPARVTVPVAGLPPATLAGVTREAGQQGQAWDRPSRGATGSRRPRGPRS